MSFLPGSPTLYLSLLTHPQLKAFDLSSLRIAVTGAANVAPELVLCMRQELGFESVFTAYGLTECCGVATVCRPKDDVQTIATTCGRPLPGVELRCVGGDGNSICRRAAAECFRESHEAGVTRGRRALRACSKSFAGPAQP